MRTTTQLFTHSTHSMMIVNLLYNVLSYCPLCHKIKVKKTAINTVTTVKFKVKYWNSVNSYTFNTVCLSFVQCWTVVQDIHVRVTLVFFPIFTNLNVLWWHGSVDLNNYYPGDECSLDDISAFLEESDDEDGEEGDKMDDIKSNSDVPLSTTDHASCGNLTSETNEGTSLLARKRGDISVFVKLACGWLDIVSTSCNFGWLYVLFWVCICLVNWQVIAIFSYNLYKNVHNDE